MEVLLKELIFAVTLFFFTNFVCRGQDYDGGNSPPAAPPHEADNCNGIFLSYIFMSREKEYPHVKNATAQAWAFKSTVTIMNTGIYDLKEWKMFIGFQHQELLVSASNAVLVDGNELPAPVGTNGTYLSGFPQTDLKTSIETAGDLTQIQVQVQLTGTQFGIKPPGVPMPKTIRLANDGFKCPAPTRHASSMYVCCLRDPKVKVKNITTKYFPRQDGGLSLSYDFIQVYDNNYLAQVTIENNNPLGRLDHWNLTWEWMRGEFIYTMRGAYTHQKDYSDCIYGVAGQYYQDFDFSQVMNCQKKPVIADLPPDRAKDEKIGNLPYCCRNGSLLPTIMNATKARSIFQVQVYKLPPDLNKTALYPPENWKIIGVVNPDYKCGTHLRVDATEFPDPSGLQATTSAIASWQVVCNITRPKIRENHCCVSFSAYFNESVIPCNTCGCGDTKNCNPNVPPLLLPPETLLVPFENRTLKAVHWARIKHYNVPRPLPCGDHCGVSINWHIVSNYRNGWTARITLLNWEEINFEDWFVAVQMKNAAPGFEKAYSFNGTLLEDLNDTIFLKGLLGLNYLIGETNGTNPARDPKVPGKQQSVIMFTKKRTHGIDVVKGDGFPSRLYFNGEECALPSHFPKAEANKDHTNLVLVVLLVLLTFSLIAYPLQ
ncbi:hypothetical protein RJ639_032577 [Escallonia herrerae]|uniref:COBRA C-terminal domain-containing protein n=1 Tax=Escallonia herrerae TaxID=1293975 RepID=A0AA88XAS6_9ASTE|nr:hypothetical protein RJ639_032577 [Escallonia herrerae]